jgi:hypothetical protein
LRHPVAFLYIYDRLASVVYAMAGGVFLLLRAITPWQGWRVHVTAINRLTGSRPPHPCLIKTTRALTQDEATRLAYACTSHEERLVVWTLLDTGCASPSSQTHPDAPRLAGTPVDGLRKGGSYGSRTKRRVLPLSPRVQPRGALRDP